MTPESELTIPEAAKAYGINLNTLYSWKRDEKIQTRETSDGEKKKILVDLASLEAHIAARNPTEKSDTAAKPKSVDTQTGNANRGMDSAPPSDNGDKSPPKSEKKGRKKPRVKSPRQHAKNMMRSFSSADLLNIQHWITQRLESRLKEATETAAT